MKASFDISLYPLTKDFEIEIKKFIRKLRQTDFELIENPLSTQIYGDFDEIMLWLKDNLHQTFLEEEHCVVTIKIVNSNRITYTPFKD